MSTTYVSSNYASHDAMQADVVILLSKFFKCPPLSTWSKERQKKVDHSWCLACNADSNWKSDDGYMRGIMEAKPSVDIVCATLPEIHTADTSFKASWEDTSYDSTFLDVDFSIGRSLIFYSDDNLIYTATNFGSPDIALHHREIWHQEDKASPYAWCRVLDNKRDLLMHYLVHKEIEENLRREIEGTY